MVHTKLIRALLQPANVNTVTGGGNSRRTRAPMPQARRRYSWPGACCRDCVYDTVIGGGGPAGLSAALVLGRCRRAVLLCDTGTPRNARARALHGFSQTQRTQSDLPRRLSCHLTRHGLVKTDHLGRTGVPELYVAGDASRDVQFAVFAAAEGAKAGVAINQALQEQL